MKIYQFNTRNFTVKVETIEERFPDLSFDESGEICAQIESGELEVFTVHTSVHCNGMLVGEDYLGNNIYKTPKDFRDHVGMRKRGHGSYFSDMIREACLQARRTINSMPALRK